MLAAMLRTFALAVLLLPAAACGGDDDGIEEVGVPVSWNYRDAVTLTAENFRLRLLESSAPLLHSNAEALVYGSGFTAVQDAGTLQVEWTEAGNQMRIYFYFTKDETSGRWYLSTIQHHDGLFPQGWVYYTGPFWDSALGEPFTGDVQMMPDAGQPGAELRFDGLTVQAFKTVLPD